MTIRNPEALCNHIRYQRMVEDWRWQQRWAVVPLEDLPERSIPANQEDHVYLTEVVEALGRRTRPDVLHTFLENCDAQQGQSNQGRMTPTEVSRVRKTRAWVREWAEENG